MAKPLAKLKQLQFDCIIDQPKLPLKLIMQCFCDIFKKFDIFPLTRYDFNFYSWESGKAFCVCLGIQLHNQFTIFFFRENFFHGLIGQNSIYAIFDPPRYFSSSHLKLTYHNSLETTEYIIDEVARNIDLHPKRFPVVAALLGKNTTPCLVTLAQVLNSILQHQCL